MREIGRLGDECSRGILVRLVMHLFWGEKYKDFHGNHFQLSVCSRSPDSAKERQNCDSVMFSPPCQILGGFEIQKSTL